MNEQRVFLIESFLAERPDLAGLKIPSNELEQRRLLRGLMNTRPAGLPNQEILSVQDAYLQA